VAHIAARDFHPTGPELPLVDDANDLDAFGVHRRGRWAGCPISRDARAAAGSARVDAAALSAAADDRAAASAARASARPRPVILPGGGIDSSARGCRRRVRVETWPSSKLREQRSNSRSAGGSKNPLSPLSPVARTGQFWINAYLIAHITTPHFLYFEADCRRLHVKNRRLQVRPLLGGATPGKKKIQCELILQKC
jgi:hypothetical protein